MAEKQGSFRFPLPKNSDRKVWLHGITQIIFDKLFDLESNTVEHGPDQYGVTASGESGTVVDGEEYRQITIVVCVPKQ